MANNNEFADLENYRKCLLATHFYKTGTALSNGNPTDRFFGYVGPNGTTFMPRSLRNFVNQSKSSGGSSGSTMTVIR